MRLSDASHATDILLLLRLTYYIGGLYTVLFDTMTQVSRVVR